MNIFSTLASLEDNDELHLGRLLVLISVFMGKNGTGTIEGLTKLAKLDFLLRYPVFLERALENKKAPPEQVNVAEHERKSVESNMVRYRYGPWDFRYRRFMNLLVAKGLAHINIEARTIHIGLTEEGLNLASQLSQSEAFNDLVIRAKLLKKYFNLSGTTLMKFVYETFPEVATLRLGEEISHEN